MSIFEKVFGGNPIKSLEIMKIDFHVHTSYSHDASDSPQKLIDRALQIGLDAICITDHNTIAGLEETAAYASDKPILIIPGIEIHTRDGHVLGINVTKKIEPGLNFEDTVRQIRDGGGIAILAHPFFWPHHFKAWERVDFTKIRDYFDGIEIINTSVFRRANRKARVLAEKFGLPVTAGSDSHSRDYLGKGFIELTGHGLTSKEVVEAILSNHPGNRVIGQEIKLLEKVKSAGIIFRETRKTRVRAAGTELGIMSFLKNRVKRRGPKIGRLGSSLGLSPNFFTLLSMGFGGLVLIFLVKINLIFASIFFAAAIFLDFVDGALARATGQETTKGAYLDTVADRYVEALAWLGFLFLPLPTYFFAPQIWIFLGLFGGLMTAYVKAAAAEKNLVQEELPDGFFSRPERTLSLLVAMAVGLFDLKLTMIILIFVALAANLAAWQRFAAYTRHE